MKVKSGAMTGREGGCDSAIMNCGAYFKGITTSRLCAGPPFVPRNDALMGLCYWQLKNGDGIIISFFVALVVLLREIFFKIIKKASLA